MIEILRSDGTGPRGATPALPSGPRAGAAAGGRGGAGIVGCVQDEAPTVGSPGRRRRPTAPRELQLPSGRHGLPRRYVVANQRQRIVDALVHVVFAYGFQAASVERVSARAGVSRRTFYEQFESKEDAFAQATDAAAAQLLVRVEAATAIEATTSDRLRKGLAALLDALAGQPQVAHLCIVAVLTAGPLAIERRDAQMRAFARLLDEIAASPLPPLTSEGIVGAVYDVVYKRIAAGRADELPGLLDDLHRFCALLVDRASDPREA